MMIQVRKKPNNSQNVILRIVQTVSIVVEQWFPPPQIMFPQATALNDIIHYVDTSPISKSGGSV